MRYLIQYYNIERITKLDYSVQQHYGGRNSLTLDGGFWRYTYIIHRQMSDLLGSSLLEQNCLLLRNDHDTGLTKSMEIGSVTYLIVTTTEAEHRKRVGDDGREWSWVPGGRWKEEERRRR